MPKRLRVLMSAYACEPNRGSEPEVGWRWAVEMARHHDVTVLTRANNRPPIESQIATIKDDAPRPEFIYCDLGDSALRWKRRIGGTQIYYWRWQRTARRRVARLIASEGFDLLHHTTFAGYRYPVAILGHGIPSLWGPIGGMEQNPWRLMPWQHPPSLAAETARNLLNLAQSTRFAGLKKRAVAATKVLASTPEMQQALSDLGVSTMLMPTIGLGASGLSAHPKPQRQPNEPLRFLFVGKMISWKGADLAVEALAASGTNASLTFVGEGHLTDRCRRIAQRLGLGQRVRFLGQKPRADVLKLYRDFDLLLFPSLHDSGGYVVLEAMANGLPVICLDCGGPALAVKSSCGIKVPLGRRTEVIAGLAEGIRCYQANREMLITQTSAALDVVRMQYDWQKKGEYMNAVYQEITRPT